MTDPSRRLSATSDRRAVGALTALSVAAFGYVTAEMLPIGLLTVMAADLDRSRAEIGLLVTGYAVVVVTASVPLARLTQRVPRRMLFAGTLGVFAAAMLVSALAQSYQVLFVARLLIALTQALFWSVVVPTAASLFGPEVRGRVVARMGLGPALGPVLGVPVGTWLGQQAGWRAAFAVLAGIGLVTCAVVTALLPAGPPPRGAAARGSAPDRRRYAFLLFATAVGVTGTLTVQTYITPFLVDVSGFAAATLGPLLLIAGLAGLGGTLVVGRFLDRHPWAAMAAPLLLITAALLGLYALGQFKVPTVALLAVAAAAFSALAVAVQYRVLQVAPVSTDVASAGAGSAFNVGIAAGALLGGVLVEGAGVRLVALAGGLLTAIAAVILLAELRPTASDDLVHRTRPAEPAPPPEQSARRRLGWPVAVGAGRGRGPRSTAPSARPAHPVRSR
ncbi:MFS transporter [Plantactinospora solaniradicis]|uniref:MFS transporter n=1 Tax=Plantactinospora solaniradicis TaxID=1723736 RepID=A0ABW1KJ45_9ACTN